MTQQDAELFYQWLIATYGDPSNGSATVMFVDADSYYQRQRNTKRNGNGGMHAKKHRQHDESDDKAER
jgi:hypothetical protein